MLTDHFVKKYSVQYNKPFPGISAELSRMFMEFDWPGNVRQLENLIKRMVVLGSEAPIVHELRQPAAALHHWPNTTPPSAPRPAVVPSPQPVMPPPAAATMAAPLAGVGAPAPIGIGSVAAVAGSAAAAASTGNGNGHVSLKDIARSAAREAERELILRMLTKTRWNRKEAAEILGISYKALLYKIKENGLDKAT
jgi:DNA-binding NtrC family response regulator